MIRPSRTTPIYTIGSGAIQTLYKELETEILPAGRALIILDTYFQDKSLAHDLKQFENIELVICDASHEPQTEGIDTIVAEYTAKYKELPAAVVGIGGGSSMDTAKAVSNVLANGGKAAEYQGWDLLSKPGIYKIGVPTISGTGAEASRTCVLLNKVKNLKMGMNSDFTLFDSLVLDPDLSESVPRDQYFYTGMDTYIHCVESLAGHKRHALADAYSREALRLCREVFLSDDMQSKANREKLMVASYLGGNAIANSMVGVVHPFSAGLSVVLDTHHCIGNCIVMQHMQEFYPEAHQDFFEMMKHQKISLPQNICKNLSEEQMERLYLSTIVHEKPLDNALGADFKKILNKDKVLEIFGRL